MIRVGAHYPNGPDAKFDHEYYERTHRDLVRSRFSRWLRGLELDRGVSSGDGGAASWIAQGFLYFDSVEDFQAAMGAHGDEILGDIPRFTNVEPVIQISEIAVARDPVV